MTRGRRAGAGRRPEAVSTGPDRLLFASVHGYLDPSSGAALATRDLLELLAARGVDCRVLSTGVLDYDQETSLESVLSAMGVPFDRARAILTGGGTVAVLDLALAGVRVTLLPTASSRAALAPGPTEVRVFLDLAEQALDRFRPRVLLTYGGHPANLELMARARRRGVAVVFHRDASAVLVPSEFSRRVHRERLGLEATAIPYPIRPARVVATDPEPRYLTFVNPQPAKGLAVFARIAERLNERRPDIPILVVEGRGTVDWLPHAGIDLSGLTNLHRMANTPDPRTFYRVSRAVLVPSTWAESFGRVAAEALANGLPVLAGDRGALPETLGDAGFVLPIPARCTPAGGVPSAAEVAPWVEAIGRLWDDPAFEAGHRRRARHAARRWDDARLAGSYARWLGSVAAAGPHAGRDG
jgi:glycosyltransferase involved in cell wall biosynthesis